MIDITEANERFFALSINELRDHAKDLNEYKNSLIIQCFYDACDFHLKKIEDRIVELTPEK